MGFYAPPILVKDAQRHGLHFKPVDVRHSQWLCAIEKHDGELWLRLGFKYVKGFREQTARKLIEERGKQSFESIDDLAHRVAISRKELVALAELGALNWVGVEKHRRDALWQSELALRRVPALLQTTLSCENGSPLQMMGDTERLSADFRNSGLTIGKHLMTNFREQLRRSGVYAASDLANAKNGSRLSVAGAVICRQQPGTAKGFVFLSLEDETGVSNIIIRPKLFRMLRPTVIKEPYLVVKGTLQNQFGVVSVKAMALEPLRDYGTRLPSHDFH